MQTTKRTSVTASNLRNWVGIPAAFTALIAVGACSQTPNTAVDESTEGYAEEVAEQPNALERAAENPEEYMGENLTILGEVVEKYDSQAFVVHEEEYFAEDENLLVIAASPEAPMPDVGEYVELTGELQRFDAAELDKSFDVVLDEPVLQAIAADFGDAPFLLADNIKYSQTPIE